MAIIKLNETTNTRIKIVKDEKLNLLDGIDFVKNRKCGALSTFTGYIRDTDYPSDGTGPRKIKSIFYEAYESMTSSTIQNIIEEIMSSPKEWIQDENIRVYTSVRLGEVPVEEEGIIICVSSTGREVAHKSTMRILEDVKSTAPIWKKIIFQDGKTEWKS